MEMPNRKSPRLKGYDYSTPGAYFITICVQDRKCILSRITEQSHVSVKTELTKFGKIAQDTLVGLTGRYPFLSVDCFTIMPNHIHVMMVLTDSVRDYFRPTTVIDIVRVYKSLTSIECRKLGFEGKLFQTSFYDHVVRNREDYEEIYKYIEGNPSKWKDDEFYGGK